MNRRLWVLFLGFVLLFVPLGQLVQAQTKLDDQTAKVKAEIVKRVANGKQQVKLKLRSGEELKGRLDEANANDFTVTDDKGGQSTTVAYTDVARVEGRGLSPGAKFGIIAAAVGGAAVIAIVVASRNFDPFKNGIPLRGVTLP